WLKTLIHSLFKPERQARPRKTPGRYFVPGSFHLECLEERALLTSVTLDTSNLAANATAIVINGTGFDPIVANNSVVFNDGAAGTITAATPTSLTVVFTTDPTAAGSLTAIVTSDAVSSGAAVQVATVTPIVTGSSANLAADATTLTISGFGFD